MTTTETIAFRMELDAGAEAEYKLRHDQIWPELAALLKQAGVIDYRIWLDTETQYLFAQLERSRDHDMAKLPNEELMKRWWGYMADIMKTNTDNSPIQESLKLVFHFSA